MAMDSLDPAWVQAQISSPPFVTIEGVSNVRSLGDYPSTSTPGLYTKPNFIFRSGEISGITSNGKSQLQELGIKKIYDLRSDTEVVKSGSPPPEFGAAVEIQRIPVFKNEDYSPEMLTRRSKQYASGKIESSMEVYSDILDGGTTAYIAIFEHIRDRPGDGFLFHCTAGKDRTGVLAALIMKTVGVDEENIAKDYALTRVGRAPQLEEMVAKLSTFPDYADNKEGVYNALSCRHEAMIAFSQLLEHRYGGIEQYLQSVLGFSTEDIAKIQSNLVAEERDPPFKAVSLTSGEVVIGIQ